ncbi:ATP adenylyltransferase [Piromyces finnis]|uniref:ATP adenylyltransferase n=1 Tax=Piromyces finnis TaxID=1754191 RepID=A0A1Y1VGV9_9FUNG|nr:ATP adenylyltransferase [Piromyces finnis]|eukprot:ORX55967.1 ATP adenylyltransferase [Piromyces finnis]
MADSSLITKVAEVFEKALSSEFLTFIPSVEERLQINKINYQIRCLPSLKKKPTQKDTSKSKFNPFLPYDENLYIQKTPNNLHNVLLNKFSVIKYHILLTTVDFQSQQDPLNIHDLESMLWTLNSIKKDNYTELAFFNCGTNSGASQPHKHLQILAIDKDIKDMPPVNRIIIEEGQTIEKGKIFQISQYKLKHGCVLFPEDKKITAEDLLNYYNSLLNIVPSNSSYNFICTTKWMLIVPRSKETYNERISVNSLGFAGMVLVKSMEDSELIKKDGIETILNSLGY